MKAHLLDGATIVVGIVLALLLDQGWRTASDRLEEREAIAGLRAEFETGRSELAADQQARRDALARLERLLRAAEGGPAVHPDSVAAFTAAMLDYRFYTPSHPVLDDLIASGRLHLLRSDALRYRIMRYLQERDRLAIVEERERRFSADRMEPWLLDHLPLGPPRTPDDEVLWGPHVDPESLDEALLDPSFRTLLVLRVERTDIALRFSSGLGRSLEAALASLDPRR
ncbi:hypothetical protein [Gaopeijia maritima]|uniref:Uncharacterized protein n=1 Tax=Gaopeijia maritima TaxID=3119007 RepID=A0ABU9EB68_9BACT